MKSIMPHGQDLDTVLEKVGRSLSERFGIRVICRGNACATNGRTIFLPSLPDQLPPGTLQVIRGYLDHESGHILGKTDFRIFEQFKDAHGSGASLFLNMLEDLRIEEVMLRRFPGSRNNLDAAHFRLLEEAGTVPDHVPAWRQLAFGVHTRGNRRPDPPCVGPEVRRTLDLIQDAVLKAPRCRNAREVTRLAEKTWPIVSRLFTPPPAPVEDPGAERKRPGGRTGSDAANAMPDSAGGPGKSPDRADAAAGDRDGDQDNDQDGGEDDDQVSGEDGAGDGDGADLPADDPDAGQSTSEGQVRDEAGGPDADASDGGNRGDAASADVMRSLADAIVAMVNDHSRSGRAYRVWTTEFDTVQTARDDAGVPHGRRMAALLPHVAGVRRKLLQTLMAEPKARWLGDREAGRIAPRALHRLVLPQRDDSADGRVFRERVRTRRLRTAVTLLVDLSGSMDGRKLKLAGDTALVFCEALSRLDIPCCVVGFSTGDRDYYLNNTEAKTGMSFDELSASYRIAPLRHIYFKRFHEPFRAVSGRFDVMRSTGVTPLGESILFAARELAGRREERKVLFALTDGKPVVGLDDEATTFRHARDSIARVERAGIDVALVGILENCVADLHHRSVVVNSLDDLPKTVMRQLRSVLADRSRRQKT